MLTSMTQMQEFEMDSVECMRWKRAAGYVGYFKQKRKIHRISETMVIEG